MNVRNQAIRITRGLPMGRIIMSVLATGRTTALIAIIEIKFAFMGASIEAPIFF